MRTTLTLDDDVAVKLRAEVRRSGRSLKDVVNDCLRIGLLPRRADPGARFRIEPRDLGALRPGLSLDSISNLLDAVEGPLHE